MERRAVDFHYDGICPFGEFAVRWLWPGPAIFQAAFLKEYLHRWMFADRYGSGFRLSVAGQLDFRVSAAADG